MVEQLADGLVLNASSRHGLRIGAMMNLMDCSAG
jgi:hypothetical protein